MSAQGVLSLMEHEAMDRMASGFPRHADALHDARDTIAELIEAATALRERTRNGGTTDEWKADNARLDAALARAGGAKT